MSYDSLHSHSTGVQAQQYERKNRSYGKEERYFMLLQTNTWQAKVYDVIEEWKKSEFWLFVI